MVKYLSRIMLFLSALWLAPAVALAQAADCPEIVQTALDAADQICAETGRNQACYGHIALTAELQPGTENVTFEREGDVVNVAQVASLRLNPMDVTTGEWGVALMNLQANLPDTLPGQNVTFLLFGDVEITNAVTADNADALQPMQAFYLRTGIGDAACEEAPESGLLVQTPEGASSVVFNVNGVDVEMGSTIFFQSDADDGMTVSTLEGAAYVASQEGRQPILPGTWVRVRLNRQLQAIGAPDLPESYEQRMRLLQQLPIRLLRRRINIARPLTRRQIQFIRTRIRNGQPLCGEGDLPSCEEHPFLARLQECVLVNGPQCINRPGRRGG
jgi:hypothetical protein